MNKLPCPRCQSPLSETFGCSQCHGRLMGFGVLRMVCPEDYLRKCIEKVKAQGENSSLHCPQCKSTMEAIFLPGVEPKVQLDFCLTCQSIWFDENEIAQLPKKSAVEKARIEAQQLEDEAIRRKRFDDKKKQQRKAANGAMVAVILTIS